MHECGHGSLFRSGRLNRGFGFVFGVLCGMPQFVWSQHHQFHHAHNGNWDRYRGPLNTAPVAEYAAMSVDQRRRYRRARSIWLAPLAGFMYVIVHPRLTWLRGSAGLLRHVLAGKRADARASIGALAAAYRTPCWAVTAAVAAHDVQQPRAAGAVGPAAVGHRAAAVCRLLPGQCVAGRRCRTVAVCRAAQLRAVLRQRRRGLGLHPRRDRRHQLPAPARLAELVHRQHRLPPHPPPVGAHPELLPGGLPRRIRACTSAA